ncbi:MAG TPA: hypothetical protein VFC54_03245 [Pseudolabrys sp.]|nr:hypothetical protein [Pseudolabrys sp.]
MMPIRCLRAFGIGFSAALTVCVLLASGTGLLAEEQKPSQSKEGTASQRAACEPDVYRLCKWYIPSHTGITNCLHRNIKRLSPDCRAVMEGRLR